MTSNFLVSIAIITYNQEDTISQTIESTLNQKCNFNFELIIADDCSNDRTFDICLDYQKKYPDIIKVISQSSNKGLIANYADCINACTGKYITQCAGDDYWVDTHKIQKQVDFLESNPEYQFVRTGGYVLNTRTKKLTVHNAHDTSSGQVFDIAKQGTIAAAPSICFNRELLKLINFEEFEQRNFAMEDYPMQVIFAKNTLFGYIPDLTYVYRSSHNSLSKPKLNDNYIKYVEGFYSVKKYLSELYPTDYPFNNSEEENKIHLAKLRIAIVKFKYSEAVKIRKHLLNNKSNNKLLRFTSNIFIFYPICVIYRFLKTS